MLFIFDVDVDVESVVVRSVVVKSVAAERNVLQIILAAVFHCPFKYIWCCGCKLGGGQCFSTPENSYSYYFCHQPTKYERVIHWSLTSVAISGHNFLLVLTCMPMLSVV